MAVKQTTPPEAHDTFEKNASTVYLDVRTEEEFAAGHAPRALNIPVVFIHPGADNPMSPNPKFLSVVKANIPHDATLIIGCKSGRRSLSAADILVQAGFTNVSNMQGGFEGGQDEAERPVPGWKAAGLPVSTDTGDGVSYSSLAAKADVKL